jgi:hypothetical protein
MFGWKKLFKNLKCDIYGIFLKSLFDPKAAIFLLGKQYCVSYKVKVLLNFLIWNVIIVYKMVNKGWARKTVNEQTIWQFLSFMTIYSKK